MRQLIRTPERKSEVFLRGALAIGVPMLSVPVIVLIRIGAWSWGVLALTTGLVAGAAILGGLVTLVGAWLYQWAYRRLTRTPDFPDVD